jgi:hypothetical protein
MYIYTINVHEHKSPFEMTQNIGEASVKMHIEAMPWADK